MARTVRRPLEGIVPIFEVPSVFDVGDWELLDKKRKIYRNRLRPELVISYRTYRELYKKDKWHGWNQRIFAGDYADRAAAAFMDTLPPESRVWVLTHGYSRRYPERGNRPIWGTTTPATFKRELRPGDIEAAIAKDFTSINRVIVRWKSR